MAWDSETKRNCIVDDGYGGLGSVSDVPCAGTEADKDKENKCLGSRLGPGRTLGG